MRHRIVHDDMNVDEDILWTVAALRLRSLLKALSPLVPPETGA